MGKRQAWVPLPPDYPTFWYEGFSRTVQLLIRITTRMSNGSANSNVV